MTVKGELRWEGFFLRVQPSAFLSLPLYSNRSLSPGVSTISTIVYRPSCRTSHPREDRNLKESSRKDIFLKSRFSFPPSNWYAETGCHRNNETISRCRNWGFCAEAFFTFNNALRNKQKSQRSYPFDPSWRSLVNEAGLHTLGMPCKSH